MFNTPRASIDFMFDVEEPADLPQPAGDEEPILHG